MASAYAPSRAPMSSHVAPYRRGPPGKYRNTRNHCKSSRSLCPFGLPEQARSVLLNKINCFKTHAFSSKKNGQGRNAWNFFTSKIIHNQSAPVIHANNITFVPFQCLQSEVKTRPECCDAYELLLLLCYQYLALPTVAAVGC